MALVAIKNQNKAVQVFKMPVAPRVKKDKKIILSEESYLKVKEICNRLKINLLNL